MAALTLDGTDVPVAQDGQSATSGAMFEDRRAYGGAILSGQGDAGDYAAAWRFTTDEIDVSEGDAIEAILAKAGTISADGYLVGGAAVDVYAAGVSRASPGPLLDTVVLSFELLEAEP